MRRLFPSLDSRLRGNDFVLMKDKQTKLLFITQKIHEKDDDLAFVILWVNEFRRQGVDVQVICLEKGEYKGDIPVYSLGKENGVGKIGRVIKFLSLILKLKYNRVFVHMNPEYVTLGGWYWFLTRKSVYLWYTHYTMHIHLWLSGILCRRMFAATKQSLPQYEGKEKKVVTGHGIDIEYWTGEINKVGFNDIKKKKEENKKLTNLLAVHRLCRSKHLDITIKALTYLPDKYTLTVYGRDVEKDYVAELHSLVQELGLESRVKFMGPVPMEELIGVYGKFDVMVNMAGETIDKTMVEGMLFGLFPITTPGNSEAIGLPIWPDSESPEDIAKFIREEKWSEYDKDFLSKIVKQQHGLPALIEKMNAYIKVGN